MGNTVLYKGLKCKICECLKMFSIQSTQEQMFS